MSDCLLLLSWQSPEPATVTHRLLEEPVGDRPIRLLEARRVMSVDDVDLHLSLLCDQRSPFEGALPPTDDQGAGAVKLGEVRHEAGVEEPIGRHAPLDLGWRVGEVGDARGGDDCIGGDRSRASKRRHESPTVRRNESCDELVADLELALFDEPVRIRNEEIDRER